MRRKSKKVCRSPPSDQTEKGSTGKTPTSLRVNRQILWSSKLKPVRLRFRSHPLSFAASSCLPRSLPLNPPPSLAVSGCFSSGSPRAAAPRPCAGCIACDSCGTLLTAQAENPDYLFFNLNFIICNRFSEKGTHKKGRRGTVAPLLSADLWSSDNTVHTQEGV